MAFHSSPNIGKGALTGFISGLIATAIMSAFMMLMGQLTSSNDEESSEEAQDGSQQGAKENQDTSHEGESEESEESGSATAQTAEFVAETVFKRELDKDKREPVGQAVHYAFGGMMGALYGAAAEVEPRVTTGAGVPFGTAVWLGADEVALPVLNLSEGPTKVPVSVHASALAAHLIYGFCTEALRKAIRTHL